MSSRLFGDENFVLYINYCHIRSFFHDKFNIKNDKNTGCSQDMFGLMGKAVSYVSKEEPTLLRINK